MTKVFISYAGTDREQADELHQWLVTEGHEVFLAQDLRDGIVAGEQWRLRLYEKLRWADAVVSVLTRAYVASTWCTAEVAIAQSRGSCLIPILDEPTVVHPLLSDAQHIDRTRNPGWFKMLALEPSVEEGDYGCSAFRVFLARLFHRVRDVGRSGEDHRIQLIESGDTGS